MGETIEDAPDHPFIRCALDFIVSPQFVEIVIFLEIDLHLWLPQYLIFDWRGEDDREKELLGDSKLGDKLAIKVGLFAELIPLGKNELGSKKLTVLAPL